MRRWGVVGLSAINFERTASLGPRRLYNAQKKNSEKSEPASRLIPAIPGPGPRPGLPESSSVLPGPLAYGLSVKLFEAGFVKSITTPLATEDSNV
eukprot:746632-Hanusia_phi.AAC.5